jgi:hypothetical protein
MISPAAGIRIDPLKKILGRNQELGIPNPVSKTRTNPLIEVVYIKICR